MKKIVFGLAMTAAVACLGDAANRLITFSTPGPDKYADGVTVMDGERYALVYVKGAFGGITADGQAADADDTVLAVLSRAKNGRCPTTVFQVDSKIADSLAGGSYAVVMLDTRLAPASDGTVKLAALDAKTGVPTAIAAATEVTTPIGVSAYAGATVTGAALADKAVATADPANAPQPVIKSIRVEGAYVYVTVANTIPALQYTVASGATPDAIETKNATAAQGAATVDEEITIVAPKAANGAFFKVQRP